MNKKTKKIFLLVLIAVLMFLASRTALAQQGPMITFRFDDGLTSQYVYAKPILNKYNFSAINYIFINPPEGNWEGHMTWAQIEELEDVYGWEIGSHSKSHPDLTKVSDSKLIAELSESKAILESHNLNIESFASPFGAYDNRVLSYIAKYYKSHTSAWPFDFNSYPFDDYAIVVQEVENSTSVEQAKNWIDQAVLEGKWLVLLFHEIVESNPTQYEYLKDNFEQIVDYVSTKSVPVVTVKQALDMSNGNLVFNPSFKSVTNSWADNWIRTDTINTSIDTNNNGAFPESNNSLKIIGGPDTYIVHNKDFINVDHSKTYLLKVYFNCQDFVSGGVDVFTDEYDSQGNWVNWTWQTGIWSNYVGYKSVVYTPGRGVGNLLIWIEGVANNNSICYVDNIVLTDIAQKPISNLVPNSSFESTNNSWADNWIRTDTINTSIDTNNNGAFPESNNSLKIIGGSNVSNVYNENFINIDPNKTYSLKVYFNCPDFTNGGVDVFTDEYGSQGNWVNWTWQTGIWSNYVGYKSIIYTPSQNTDKILILIQNAAGSNLTCYIDDIVLTDE